MERAFIYLFAIFLLIVDVLGRLRGEHRMIAGKGLSGTVAAVLVIGVMFLDDRLCPYGISASMLASDLLFLDSAVLHDIRFISEKKRLSVPFLLFFAAGIARSAVGLAGRTLPLDARIHMVGTSGLILSCSMAEDIVRALSSKRLRSLIPEHIALLLVKSACAQGLAFQGIIILSASASRPVCLAVCILLAGMYAYLRHSLGAGIPVMKAMPVGSVPGVRLPQTVPDHVTEESKRIDLLFERVEAYMQKEKPYLDDNFKMTQLATEMMTNKTMLSKTINDKSGKNFCRYVNAYRIRYAVSLMENDKRLKVSELSLMSGFHTVASFNMAFKLVMNDTPSEYMRTLHSAGLARPEEGERSAPRESP